MIVSDYIVNCLIKEGVTDAFGIPGGVVLDLLYAMDKRKNELRAHLNYHEQGAAFAACGYAQISGKLGVAYATRGPGISNMVTCIADAYYDSIPVLFITAHSQQDGKSDMRIEIDQEMNPLPMVRGITKYAARVECLKEVPRAITQACHLATSGRKGPVVLDFRSSLFLEDISLEKVSPGKAPADEKESVVEIAACIKERLAHAKRPIFLIGGGIRQSDTVALMRQLVEQTQIPVLSSRIAQDVMPDDPLYFGFIGSHSIRYSNFILSKTDLIIALGNRMSVPVDSLSYRPVLEKAITIRIDVDETEFLRKIPNSIPVTADLRQLMPCLLRELPQAKSGEWLSICNQLRDTLWHCDKGEPVDRVAKLLSIVDRDAVLTCDVGNHEFWLSHAYTYGKAVSRILYSHSFGTLGCSLPKAIGAYYAVRKPVICFTGDQGLQLNIQELQFIAQHKLPITVVVLNNASSGMIRSREVQRFDSRFVHTTKESGYGAPDFAALAGAYGMNYLHLTGETIGKANCIFCNDKLPHFLELSIDEAVDIAPYLPKGNPLQALSPILPEDVYRQLDVL